jgi:hypothetical protein
VRAHGKRRCGGAFRNRAWLQTSTLTFAHLTRSLMHEFSAHTGIMCMQKLRISEEWCASTQNSKFPSSSSLHENPRKGENRWLVWHVEECFVHPCSIRITLSRCRCHLNFKYPDYPSFYVYSHCTNRTDMPGPFLAVSRVNANSPSPAFAPHCSPLKRLFRFHYYQPLFLPSSSFTSFQSRATL